MKRSEIFFLFAVLLFLFCFVNAVSAEEGNGWDGGGEGWDGLPTATPTSTPNSAGGVLIDLYGIIYVVCPLLALVFLVLIGAGVIKTDSASITVAILVGCMIVIGLCVAFAIMSAITNSSVVPSLLGCL